MHGCGTRSDPTATAGAARTLPSRAALALATATGRLLANDPAKLQKGQWHQAKVRRRDARANLNRCAYAAAQLPWDEPIQPGGSR